MKHRGRKSQFTFSALPVLRLDGNLCFTHCAGVTLLDNQRQRSGRKATPA